MLGLTHALQGHVPTVRLMSHEFWFAKVLDKAASTWKTAPPEQ
jgi:hypothetical protein